MVARNVHSHTETNCSLGKNIKERFNTSYPWREPESAQFHRVIWSPVGAHTPTQQHEHTEQKHKHSESDSSILLNIALGVGCTFSTNRFHI